MASVAKRDRSRRADLQRMLGDMGTVLERLDRGTPERPAKGWYARLADQDVIVFLGDHTSVATLTIARLRGSFDA